MRELIQVRKQNEVFVYVIADSGISQELSEYFKFRVPGYMYMPAYKNRTWNGYIYLFNRMDYTLYSGLIPYLKSFAKERNYELDIEESISECESKIPTDLQLKSFIESLKLPFEVRDYQLDALKQTVAKGRILLLSPTASGKSLIIYSILRWFDTDKTLIIVPTVSLVSQMISDFSSYAIKDKTFDAEKRCHGIFEGQDKNTKKQIIVSTWQSIFKQPKEWFSQFTMVIGDEAHQYKAESIKNIMHKLEKCPKRIGTTGTLDGTQTNKLVLEGLFGQVYKATTTKKLMENSHIAKLKIQCVLLKYPDEEIKIVKALNYQDEIKYLIQHSRRTNFICNLVTNLKGNTMVLFQYVEKHGKIIHELIKKKVGKNRTVFYVSGETEADVREDVRKITEKEKDAIIVASVGVFSTGINIRNLDNIVFASPSKSRIRTLQSIGRVLRIGDNSDTATLYDIVDDLSHGAHKNYALKHFIERAKIYDSEKFNYKIHKVDLVKKI